MKMLVDVGCAAHPVSIRHRESTESWADLLRSCKRRGMRAPVLAVGDGALGFWKAVRDVFPDAAEQRCWFHKIANVLNALPKSAQPGAKAALAEIWNAEDREHAEQAVKAFAADYGTKWPKAVAKITDDLDCSSRSTTTPPSTGSTYAPPTDRIHLRHRPAAAARHQGTRLASSRHRDGLQAHRVRTTAVASGERALSRRTGPSRSPVREGRPRRTTRRIRRRSASRMTRRSTGLDYSSIAEQVDLGYAVTAHRAQGITVDTAHVVVSGSTTRENLYVSMTRGREANIAYVALDKPDDSHAAPQPDEITGRTVLFGVLQHSGVELSAHQTIETEQEQWSSIAQLAAEYETIAAVAQRERWAALVRSCDLSTEQAEAVIESDSFGPSTAELRRAEANHHDVEAVLPTLVARRTLDDADDVGAVLLHRLSLATAQPVGGRRRREPRLIAGLIPEAVGPMADEMRTALQERRRLIEARAQGLAEDAVRSGAPWLSRLGQPPSHPRARERWIRAAETVVAYRDRYRIDSRTALGETPTSDAQHLDAARANAAIRRAATLATESAKPDAQRRSAEVESPSIR